MVDNLLLNQLYPNNFIACLYSIKEYKNIFYLVILKSHQKKLLEVNLLFSRIVICQENSCQVDLAYTKTSKQLRKHNHKHT